MTATFLTSTSVSGFDLGLAHVILVGLPGAGKSTVGRALAERLGKSFLDFDLEIERREGATVAEIFAGKGEHYFRQKERDLTEEVAGLRSMILAPGGGWVANPDVVALLRPPARMIYLKTDPAIALLRLGEERSSRPLLSRMDPRRELERLLADRRRMYESADHVIDTQAVELNRLIEQVAELASRLSRG